MLKNLKLTTLVASKNIYFPIQNVDWQELEEHLKIASGGTIDGVPTC